MPPGRPRNIAVAPQFPAGPAVIPAQFISRAPTPFTPPIRADELGPGRTDRLGASTFTWGDFSIFIPGGAVGTSTNSVHVFYSPGGVTGGNGGNAVAVHGLRSAAERSRWIVIGVPDLPGGSTTIGFGQITACLAAVGLTAPIGEVRLSAHSRGNAGLAATLRGRLIPPALIQHVTILDGQDHQRSLTSGLQSSRIPPSSVTAYNIVFGSFQPYSVTRRGRPAPVQNIQLPFGCLRSIGYVRSITDWLATGRGAAPLPPDIDRRVAALRLPSRATFTTDNPAPAGFTNVNSYCGDPANSAALQDLRVGEPPSASSLLSRPVQTARASTSPYAFMEENNVLAFNHPSVSLQLWYRANPKIYSHHLFVAELAHEMFR